MRTCSPWITALAPLMASLLFSWQVPEAQAGGCNCPQCLSGQMGCGGANEFALVERTVNVPTLVPERRIVNVTEYVTEQRQRTINVSKLVPETRQVTDVYTVMVPEVRQRTETYLVQKPVWREVDQTFTVEVPYQEQRQAVRHVCRQVQVEVMQTVQKDHGKWEDEYCEESHYNGGCANQCASGCRRRFRICGGCGSCNNGCGSGYDAGSGQSASPHIHRVWRPNIVTEEVPVMVWRNEMVEEPFQYTVTVCRTEQQVRRVKVCEYVAEEQSRDVQFTVCVPQQRERVRNVTSYRTVTEPHVETFAVQVPQQVAKEVEVQVCRMVEKKVIMRVPVYYSYGGYGGFCPPAPCGPYCP